MVEYIVAVVENLLITAGEFFCIFEIGYFVVIINFEVRRYHLCVLRQKYSGTFAVAVSSFGPCTEILINIKCNTLMN